MRDFGPDEYRKFVRTLPDKELIKPGKRLRILSSDRKIVTTTPCVFDQPLKIGAGITNDSKTNQFICVFHRTLELIATKTLDAVLSKFGRLTDLVYTLKRLMPVASTE